MKELIKIGLATHIDMKQTLKPGASSIFSCATGGAPFTGTLAAGASDMVDDGRAGGFVVDERELGLMNRFLFVKLEG